MKEKLALQDLLDEINQIKMAREAAFMKQSQVMWENSALGMATAEAINNRHAPPQKVAMNANLNLVTPGGKVMASYIFDNMMDYGNANGTPILTST